MPTFNDVEVTLYDKIDIEFEVYCGTCGAGLCSESDTRRSKNRNYLQVTVNACPYCIEEKDLKIKEKDLEIEELKLKIEKLYNEIDKLKLDK